MNSGRIDLSALLGCSVVCSCGCTANRATLSSGCSCRFGHQRSLRTFRLWLLHGTQEAAQNACAQLKLEVALWHNDVKNGAGCLGGRPGPVLVLNITVRGLVATRWIKIMAFYRNSNTALILFTFSFLIFSVFQFRSSGFLLPLPYFFRFMFPRDLLSGAVWTKTVSFSDLINVSAIFSSCGWFPLLHNHCCLTFSGLSVKHHHLNSHD